MLRSAVNTPALILDVDALDHNIATMAARAAAMGMGLRPHAKSHKCVEIARRLAEAGASGACCATIDEAEAMAAGGITGILLTSPLISADQISRLQALLANGADVMAVTDHPRHVEAYAAAASAAGVTMDVLVDFDFGLGRTGCVDLQDAVALAQNIAAKPSLRFRGVQGYWGQLQQIMPYAERERMVGIQHERLRTLVTALSGVGLKPEIVSGSGTGTFEIDGKSGLFTELQCGSFLFLDSLYGASVGKPFEVSLFVAATVVSANAPGRVIINAGYKAFATDSGLPQPARGAPEGTRYRFMGDEHGALDFTGPAPELGAVIEFVTPHCDPTVNLYANYHVVKGEEVIAQWPVAGRH